MHTRRKFLRVSLGGPLLLSLAPSVPLVWMRSAARAASLPATDDRVLVVIQLSGGNDGLNTVVPFEDDAYARNRPTLRLAASQLHKLDGQLGLHPRLEPFHRLFKEGSLAIVQGVGYPEHSRDHERAMLVWQTASPDPAGVDTGWLGRATDHLWNPNRPAAPGVFVGNIPRPFGINAASMVIPTLHNARDAFPGGAALPTGDPSETGATSAMPTSEAGSLLRHVRTTMMETQRHRARVEAAGSSASLAVPYPACGLGDDLQTIAHLIRAGIGIRIFYAELGGGGIGGFDNHANQMDNHGALLAQLAESVAAFAAELAADHLLDRVLLLTFSEFGRTVAENGRRGTDHGAASQMLLVGGKVRGGVHGRHPSLTDLDAGGLKHQTDFRSVYATALEDWLGLPSGPILGGEFPRSPLLVAG